ncbi:MAG: type IIL restriction-modification enzyme MmeI [Rhodanobacteraceae bacterium]
MPLSWNEIKDRALRFSREWADEACEDAEAQSFWNGFFEIFGVSRRRVPVRTLSGAHFAAARGGETEMAAAIQSGDVVRTIRYSGEETC